MAGKNPKKADPAAKRSVPENTSEIDLAEEQQAHQEHLQRLKKYKKKRKQQIIGLVLEVVLLVVVIVAYAGVSYMKNFFDRITIRQTTAAQTTPKAVTTELTTVSELPTIGPIHSETRLTTAVTTTSPAISDEATEPGGTDPTEPTETPEETTEEQTPPETLPPEPYTNPLPPRTETVQSGYDVFACFGVDDRDEGHMLIHTQGDVCIIISINKATGEINMVSVFRDLYFEFATGAGFMKLTDAYSRYGAEEVVAGLNRNFDLMIKDYIVVNWTAVADVVDAIGGVDIELSYKEAEQINNFIYETSVNTGRGRTMGVDIKAGMAHLDGVNAVCYCRIRKEVGSDYARTERQRKLISTVMEKVKKNLSVAMIYKIVDKVSNNLRTTLDPMELLMYASRASEYSVGQTVGFPMDHHAMKDEMISSGDYISDVSKMHEILFGDHDYQPSDNIKRLAESHARHTKGIQ